MSDQVNKAFVQQYATNVAHLLQQKGSKLRGSVMTSTATGKAAKAVEQVGAVNAQKRTTRHADTPLISTPHDARWAFPVDYEWADLIDDQDKIRMLINPQSPYATNGAYAMGRAIDDEIIGAFNATAKTGENGTGTSDLAAGHVLAHGGTGLTLAKMQAAKKLLMAAEVDVDNDPLYMAVTAEQHDDLLGLGTTTQSIDTNKEKVLVNGRITYFMGFNIIVTQRLLEDATPDRLVPVWAKSGMHVVIWNDITTKISEREDKSYATQVYLKCTVGATRLEESKVVMIACEE
jgi:hypothetical protein